MGVGGRLILVAAGAVLGWGINGDIGSVNEDAIGWILMIVGVVGLVISMIFWSSWAGPGYWSRRRGGYAEEPPPGPGALAPDHTSTPRRAPGAAPGGCG